MPSNNPDTVNFYDIATGQVKKIPSSELTSDCTRFTPLGINGPTFALLKDHVNPDLGHDLTPILPSIKSVYRWIVALVVEDEPVEWNDFLHNFASASVPERELACWIYAIDRFKAVSALHDDLSAVQQQEVFALINQICVVGLAHVLNTFELKHLTREQAELFLLKAITL